MMSKKTRAQKIKSQKRERKVVDTKKIVEHQKAIELAKITEIAYHEAAHAVFFTRVSSISIEKINVGTKLQDGSKNIEIEKGASGGVTTNVANLKREDHFIFAVGMAAGAAIEKVLLGMKDSDIKVHASADKNAVRFYLHHNWDNALNTAIEIINNSNILEDIDRVAQALIEKRNITKEEFEAILA